MYFYELWEGFFINLEQIRSVEITDSEVIIENGTQPIRWFQSNDPMLLKVSCDGLIKVLKDAYLSKKRFMWKEQQRCVEAVKSEQS